MTFPGADTMKGSIRGCEFRRRVRGLLDSFRLVLRIEEAAPSTDDEAVDTSLSSKEFLPAPDAPLRPLLCKEGDMMLANRKWNCCTRSLDVKIETRSPVNHVRAKARVKVWGNRGFVNGVLWIKFVER